MNLQTLIRSSAIIYADEFNQKTTITIRRKFVESVFMNNDNKPLNINSLVDEIENSFKLTFSEDEIREIVNKSDEIFEINNLNMTISLTQKRYGVLNRKELFQIDQCIHEYIPTSSYVINEKQMNEIIMKYLYHLLNTNIQLYTHILKSNSTNLNNAVPVVSKQFSKIEVCVINEFLLWDNKKKNELIFKLVSFCIEYSLVANNSNDSMFLNALKNKQFYLDNNVLYRAIGIDGEIRKKITDIFLQRCFNNGQKLFISKFSKAEFLETIDFHIRQLQRVPFGKINPNLFRQCNCNDGFYEFYHSWRKNRLTYGFVTFKAYLLSIYDSLLKKYKIEEDYKIPFDKNDPIIDKYKDEIAGIKNEGHDESHKIDAQNLYLIEKKRGNNDINIKDTKFYLITTDRKLKQWDEYHSERQPLTLLPSHWMGLLIKYVSRTSDDFASFVSFLRLPHHDALLDEFEIQNIVAGISEYTEDFKTQEIIMQRMIECKFENIVCGQRESSSILNNAKRFTKNFLEEEYKKQLSDKDSEKVDLETAHSKFLETKQNEYEEEINKIKQQQKNEKTENIIREIESINKRKENALPRIKKKSDDEKVKFIIGFTLYYIALIIATCKIGWNIMEPITYFLGFGGTVSLYVYFCIKGNNFDFRKYFSNRRKQIETEIYAEYDINIDELNELEEELRLL